MTLKGVVRILDDRVNPVKLGVNGLYLRPKLRDTDKFVILLGHYFAGETLVEAVSKLCESKRLSAGNELSAAIFIDLRPGKETHDA